MTKTTRTKMRFNPLKVKEHREALAYTQDRLAQLSKVSVRTIQRAEGGGIVRFENMHDIASALRVKLDDLLMKVSPEASPPALVGDVISLRQANSGRELVDVLDDSQICRIDCDVDPTEELLPVLKQAIRLVEANMPDPFSTEKLRWPRRTSLVDRLEVIAAFNSVLRDLKASGIGMYIGSRVELAIMPNYYPDEDRFFFSNNEENDEELVRATRVLITIAAADKLVVQAKTTWPVKVVPKMGFGSKVIAEDELDDDVPF